MAEIDDRVVSPMMPNTTLENTSPGTKRKAQDDLKVQTVVDLSEPTHDEKRTKKEEACTSDPASAPQLIDTTLRKVVFKQDASSKPGPSRKSVLAFGMYLLEEADEDRTLKEIPAEHWAYVAACGNEMTARTEVLFAKHLKSALTSNEEEAKILSPEVVTLIIPSLFTQIDYGCRPSDFPHSATTVKVPAALQLKYWEVQTPEKYFTKDQLELVLTRRKEREKARADIERQLAGLDDLEKWDLIKGDKADKGEKGKKETGTKKDAIASKKGEVERAGLGSVHAVAEEVDPARARRKSREGTASTIDSRRSASPVKKSKMTPEEREQAQKAKEEREAAKEARRIAKEEKQAQRDNEVKKKEEAMAKQKQTMMSFFKKPAASPVSRASPAGPSTAPAREPSPDKESDYRKTFRGITMRQNIRWAPTNRWNRHGHQSTETSPEDLQRWEVAGSSRVAGWNSNDFLQDHFQKHGVKPSRGRILVNGLKSAPIGETVAEAWTRYQEAEDPRAVSEQLKNKRKFPWKILAFDQQPRPPYRGTWTKRSLVVGPRTPLAQDPALDYSYDSSDDWQDDEGGEDVDDFGETAEADPDEEEDESEGEFDDWLDDEEDVVAVPMDLDDDIIPLTGLSSEQSKLPMKVVKKTQVPKKVVKLTPRCDGPFWEEQIGKGFEGFEGYQLQLLNDAPDSIDPFSYVSSDPAPTFKTTYSSTAIGMNLSVKCLLSAQPTTAPKPAEPASLPASTLVGTNSEDASGSKSKAAGPKIAFPTSHLPQLLKLIDGNTKIRTDLISELRGHFEAVTSKAAIEAKVKEVAVRHGKAKDSQWKVKPEAWAAAGLPPSNGLLGLQAAMKTASVDYSTF